MGTLLCVGFYPYDVVHLLTLASAAREELGHEPVFACLSPADVAPEVQAQVSAAGFEVFECLVMATPDRSTRNFVRRLRRQRQATEQLMDRLLRDIRPTAVLATVNPPPGLFLDEAARRGVPTVLVQLFHWGDGPFYRALHADDRRQSDARLSDRGRLKRNLERRVQAHFGLGPHVVWDLRHAAIAVQGPAMRRRLLAERVPAGNVVVTGNPALDDLHRLRQALPEARERLRTQLGLPADVPVVTQMRSHEERLVALPRATREASQVAIVDALREAAPGAQVVVKVHPKEDDSEKAFLRSIDRSLLVVGEEVPTNDLIAASDVVTGTLSTTLLYAVLLDRPTVSAWLWPGLDYFRRSTDWPGVERVDSADALADAVRRHLHDPGHQRDWKARREVFVADEFCFDGHSTERLVGLLERLTSLAARSAASRA